MAKVQKEKEIIKRKNQKDEKERDEELIDEHEMDVFKKEGFYSVNEAEEITKEDEELLKKLSQSTK